MLSKRVGSRITRSVEGGVCVCVCVVVVVRWQALKGRNGGNLKGYLLPTGTSDATANRHSLSPQTKPQKLSLQLSKLSADCSSQF